MADTSFFGRLTKLFRAQAVVTVDKDGKRRVVVNFNYANN